MPDRNTRKLENAKQANIADINFYPSQVKEGELLFALPQNKALRIYKKIRGMLWWVNFTRDGNYEFEKNVLINGNLNVKKDTTIEDLTQNGHKNSQTFMVNAFQYPAPGTDWTPYIYGAFLTQNLTAKKCWIPLNFLKVGDEIVSYNIFGTVVETNAVTFDCKLARVNPAAPPTTTNITGGGITQVTAAGVFDVTATLSAVETVAVDKQYTLELLGTTASTDNIKVLGAEVLINRK